MVSSSTQPSNAVEDTFETTDSQYDESDYDDEDYDEEGPKVSVVTATTQKATTPVSAVVFPFNLMWFTATYINTYTYVSIGRCN